MQLIIPMSGLGERFLRSGYKIPKPLIKVEGKHIIEHVVKIFPGIKKVIFICNKNHLENPDLALREKLLKINPEAKILEVEEHKKGPIHAVLENLNGIDLDLPTIVNYCDFNCIWDFEEFIDHVKYSDCDGCVVTYTGFHPHMIANTNYAYVKVKNKEIIDIQEKKSFTKNPMKEFASSGTYYFKTAKIMAKYFQKTVDRDLNVKGEYYVSMSYKTMIEDKCKLNIFNLDKFMQWGTPEDLEEYNWFSSLFKNKVRENNLDDFQKNIILEGTTLIPCAGLGKRFSQEGYDLPKPFIEVSKKPMAIQAINDLPMTENLNLVFRKSMTGIDLLKKEIIKSYPSVKSINIDKITNGQAETCLYGLNSENNNKPLTISACDNGIIYNKKKFLEFFNNNSIDVIVWGCENFPGAKKFPKMYGWIEHNNFQVKRVHVKKIYRNPNIDPIIVGTFTFKKASFFKEAVELLISNNLRVNDEFYVDSCINNAIDIGLNVAYFPIEYYLCWGTPNDLNTYKYWQDCFNKWDKHPYSIDLDEDFNSF